ncbi:MAG: 2-oxoglutarate dehydrogenase E1 component, partial [Flavobacteriaceae bacterium]|nr:2-oxoglutarate dehydrogenase E1 component [Flavobacteriaceae bacterium]
MADEWSGFENVREWEMMDEVDTSYNRKKLDRIAKTITSLPEGKKFLRKVEKLVGDRKKMYFESDKLDWAMGELLAYGSLLEEGFGVRMSGQDVERGTFSHRHGVMKVEESEEEVLLLNHISKDQGMFQIYNSLLSEYAVVGFDYGYAMASPNTLTIWEAQFGDFSNGAQIMIDQYISAAEDKWKIQNGLVMFLPHGYEGQGAEHSSARMERYLQLCARDNMYVADVTTPANMFHLLRRQMKSNFRKPLIVFTPKSLLRHPKAVSGIKEMTEGRFREVIDDETVKVEKVKSLVFCTGKFYYDLLAEREELGRDDVALVRVEQLFPLPSEQMKAVIKKYKKADDLVWAQEEPRNMGAWSHLMMHFSDAHKFRVASRRFYASPAAGSSVRSKMRHQQVIDYVFDKTKDNMTRPAVKK